MFRGDGGEIRGRKAIAAQRDWLDRKRLRGRGVFARDGALRYRALFDAEDRLAVAPVQDEHQARLADECYRWNLLAVVANVDHHRRRFQIIVVDVVMDRLEVPGKLARIRVKNDQCVAKETIAGTIAAVKIGRGRTKGQEDEPPFGINR